MMAALLIGSSLSYADYADIKGHWAEESIRRAIQNKILVGSEGKFGPKANITRGQFASMLSKALDYQGTAPIGYEDVQVGQWYYDPIARLVAKNLAPDAKKYQPKQEITRGEAFVLLAKAFHFKSKDAQKLDAFADAKGLSDEDRPYIASLVDQGIVVGSNGKLDLGSRITRAEFAAIMDRLVVRYVDEATTITGTIQGNIVVRVKGVVFDKATIRGKVILADGIEEKDVKFVDTKPDAGILVIAKGEEIADSSTPLASAPSGSRTTGGGAPSGGSPSGGSGGGNAGSAQQTPKFLEKVLDLEKTRVIELGYASYLTIVFREGSASDYEIYVDGERIRTRAVNDEDTIVKWEIKKLDHKELRIVKIADKQEGIYDLQKKEIVK